MKTIRLKNGSEEFGPLVAATRLTLEAMLKKDPMAFYELTMLCRDRDHKVWGDILKRWDGVVGYSDGRYTVHESIRHVVVSAVEGEEMDMTLVDPREAGQMSEHTKGPNIGITSPQLVLEEREQEGGSHPIQAALDVEGPGAGECHYMRVQIFGDDGDDSHDLARLFHAAPDLYEACERALECLEAGIEQDSVVRSTGQILQAALAKAKP